MPDQASTDPPDRPTADRPAPAALADEIREALRAVVDPEIRIDVVTLGLIRDVAVGDDAIEIRMILTTPFCPYGGILVQQVRDIACSVAGREVSVRMGDEAWSPDMMEGADLAEWGLL